MKWKDNPMDKKSLVRTLALLICLLTTNLLGMGIDAQTARLIDREIQSYKDEIIRTRRFLHMNPEL